jgi:hypothetical protein
LGAFSWAHLWRYNRPEALHANRVSAAAEKIPSFPTLILSFT